MIMVAVYKETGKRVYLNGPYYINGKEFWQIYGCSEKLGRECFDGLPVIPRKDFLIELKSLLEKYNASMDVYYEETCVLGCPFNVSFYVNDFEIFQINGNGFDSHSINIESL